MTDFLGNEYTDIVKITDLMKKTFRELVLLQDVPPDAESCKP